MGRPFADVDPTSAILVLVAGGGVTGAATAMFFGFVDREHRTGFNGVAVFAGLVLGLLLVLLLVYLLTKAVRKSKGSVLLQRLFPQQDQMVQKIQDGLHEVARQTGRPLQEIPFYVFVGEPKGGKTEAVRHGAYDWHIGPSRERIEVQGVGGTEGMDWWFTQYGAILDVAGALWEQSTPLQHKQWHDFLEVLKRGRPYVPVNGVVLCIPADSLLEVSQEKYDNFVRKAELAAQQCMGMQQALGIRFPLYVLITKSDLIPGFREFCRPIPTYVRNQIFGWSCRDDLNEPFDPRTFGARLREGLLRPIRDRHLLLIEKCEAPLNANRVKHIDSLYLFPSSVDDLLPRVQVYLDKIFTAGTLAGKPPFFRGVYFTSAMELGTALDPQLAAMLGDDVVEEFRRQRCQQPELLAGRSKTQLFLGDFLSKKMFLEVGLVSPKARPNQWRRAMAFWLMAAGGIAALAFSGWAYALARDFKDSISDQVGIWEKAANAMGPSNSRTGADFKLTSHGATGTYQADPDTARDVLKLHGMLKEDLAVPPIFQALDRPKDVESRRRRAFGEVYWQCVIEPVLRCAWQKLSTDVNNREWTSTDLSFVAQMARTQLDLAPGLSDDSYATLLDQEGLELLYAHILSGNPKPPEGADQVKSVFALCAEVLGEELPRRVEQARRDSPQKTLGADVCKAAEQALRAFVTADRIQEAGNPEMTAYEDLRKTLGAVEQAERQVLAFGATGEEKAARPALDDLANWTQPRADDELKQWLESCVNLQETVAKWEQFEVEKRIPPSGATPAQAWGALIDRCSADIGKQAMGKAGGLCLPQSPGPAEAGLPPEQRSLLDAIRTCVSDSCAKAADELKGEGRADLAKLEHFQAVLRVPVERTGGKKEPSLAAVKARLGIYQKPGLMTAPAAPIGIEGPWKQVDNVLAEFPGLRLVPEAAAAIKFRVAIEVATLNSAWFAAQTEALPDSSQAVQDEVSATATENEKDMVEREPDIPWLQKRFTSGVAFRPEFAPKAALSMVNRYVAARKRLDDLTLSDVPVLDREGLRAAMVQRQAPLEEYIKEFGRYWFVDTLGRLRQDQVELPAWKDTLKELGNRRAGARLAGECTRLFELLNAALTTYADLQKCLGIDPPVMPDASADIVTSLEQLRKPDFTQDSGQFWSAWASLGAQAPQQAAGTLAALSPADFLNTYHMFHSYKASSAAAYWQTVSAQLLARLATARTDQVTQDIDTFTTQFMRFPLAAPGQGGSLTTNDVCAARDLWRRITPPSTADKNLGGGERTGKPDLDDPLSGLLVGPAIDEKLDRAGKSAELLCSTRRTVRVSIQASGKRNTVAEYATTVVVWDGSQEKDTLRINDPKAEPELCRGLVLVGAAPVTFKFYQFLENKADPVYIVTLKEHWRFMWLAYDADLGAGVKVKAGQTWSPDGEDAWTTELELPPRPGAAKKGEPERLVLKVQLEPLL